MDQRESELFKNSIDLTCKSIDNQINERRHNEKNDEDHKFYFAWICRVFIAFIIMVGIVACIEIYNSYNYDGFTVETKSSSTSHSESGGEK